MRILRWGVAKRLRPIRLLVMDCDGTMTDGNVDNKRFDSQDGLGLMLLNIEKAVISGSPDESIKRRAEHLRIRYVLTGVVDKRAALEALLSQTGYRMEQVCYIGDDLNDLECIIAAGVGISVRNGVREVRKAADYVTRRRGGYGAIREVADMLSEMGVGR